MKFIEGYKEVVAIKERVNGNETVGATWIETKAFSKKTAISEIIDWGSLGCEGKLIITINE